MKDELRDPEKVGYDAFVEIWVEAGEIPSASKCPARWMKEGSARIAFIRGWNNAKREFFGEPADGPRAATEQAEAFKRMAPDDYKPMPDRPVPMESEDE